MFGKLNRNNLKNIYNTGKNVLLRSYHHGKNFINTLDNGVRTGKAIYDIISPSIESLAGKNRLTDFTNKHIDKGLSKYDEIKNKVVNADQRVNNEINTVNNKLKNHNIHL